MNNIYMKETEHSFIFGKRLREIRKRQGITQGQLGDAVGVTHRVISYYENETKHPPTHLLPKISKALKISIDELLGVKNMPELPKNGKLWRKLKDIEKMTPTQQKQIFDFIRLVKKSSK